jgi:NADPH:quinone reductase-like Zn-dependent oxidoreductase
MENLALWYRRLASQKPFCNLKPRRWGACAGTSSRADAVFSGQRVRSYPHHRRLSPQNPVTGGRGYEGVGIVTDAPASFAHLLGKRVLPLRGQGTWQRYVDCPAEYAIPVPDAVDAHLAARAYINPLAAQMMLPAIRLKESGCC